MQDSEFGLILSGRAPLPKDAAMARELGELEAFFSLVFFFSSLCFWFSFYSFMVTCTFHAAGTVWTVGVHMRLKVLCYHEGEEKEQSLFPFFFFLPFFFFFLAPTGDFKIWGQRKGQKCASCFS